MAGAGRRTFAPGEVLTASNVMNYLQDQAVMNFAGTAARGSAIGTAVSEGMVSYLQDNNFVQTYDGTGWRSLAGVQVVAGTAVRDALLPSPVQGDTVFRNDLGVSEMYLAASGDTPAGWVTVGGSGLIPIRPVGVVIATGSGSANSLGVVSFTGATSIQLNGVFTSAYTNYRIIVNFRNSSAASGTLFRLCSAGTPNTTANYASLKYAIYGNNTSGNSVATGQTFLDLGGISGAINAGFCTLDISEATTVFRKRVNLTTTGYSPSSSVEASWVGGGTINLTSAFDGLYLGFAAGNHTGTIQVFGYND